MTALAWPITVVECAAALLLMIACARLLRLALWRLGAPAVDGDERAAIPSPAPLVTVQLPVRNERAVAERLLRAVARLEWPRDRFEVQVLDDSDDPETSARLDAVAAEVRANAGLTVEVLRRPDRRAAKAGNLQHGLSRARGELLLVLDADSQPPPSLIARLAARLAADDTLAFVQVRWAFENEAASPLTRAQALILGGHFAVEQAYRTARGEPVALNGTSVLLRRRDVEEAGGWVSSTGDASITEDLDLADRLLRRGRRGVTLLEPAVLTELPETMAAYRAQQERWVRGNGEAMRAALTRGGLGAVVGPLVRQARQPVLVVLALLLIARAFDLVPAAPWPWLWPLVAPLVVATFALYAASAARAIGASPVAAALRAPFVIALSMGLAPALTVALARGLFASRPGAFVRTPKRGDAPTRRRTPPLAFLELALGLAALAGAAHAALAGAWLTAVGTALFVATGPLWVGGATLIGSARSR
jgi:cellulose synthase/poly-beta-1,6-N-acetylglucosamine synthase-like glycosyltransferase